MLLSSILYKKITNFSEVSGLFAGSDELSELYRFLVEKIENNKDYTVSSLFDNFEINSNSLIDKVINYVFPDDGVYETYLTETIKKIKITELEQAKKTLQNALNTCTTQDEIVQKLNEIKQIENKIKEVKSGSNR